MKRELPLSDLTRIYQPGALLVMSTLHEGQGNVMALAWHTLLQESPTRIACILRRGSKSLKALQENEECVLNVPLDEQLEQVLLCGSHSGSMIDKMELCGWSVRDASRVAAPMVRECYAHIECQLHELELIGEFNLCVLEPVGLWIDRNREPEISKPVEVHSRLWLRGTDLASLRNQARTGAISIC